MCPNVDNFISLENPFSTCSLEITAIFPAKTHSIYAIHVYYFHFNQKITLIHPLANTP